MRPLLRLLAVLLACFSALPLAAQDQNVVARIEPRGNRRIPRDTILARIFTRSGDPYDEASLQRDFNSLWNTGYFEDIRFEREETPKGWIIYVYVKEKPTIRSITYNGLNAVSTSDVLDRFKQAKVGLSQESQFDPTRVKKAEVTLKELLAEHGRQFATVNTVVRLIPPASVAITFNVKEGPKVKVGKIRFEGNKHIGSGKLKSAMKNLKPIGIPHSIILENLFSKTYDSSKLAEDQERVRDVYQQKGYFKALVSDAKTNMRDTSGGFFLWPFHRSKGKAVDLTIPIEEGERYRLGSINFHGNKAVTNVQALRAQFPMKDGDIFDTSQVRKGLENLRKAYGALGYVNFTPIPDTQIDEEKKLISLVIDLDEGKQFFVRRIEFQGNTTTRDKVIRRELSLEEGQQYNSQALDFSLLRLNQLGYFEQLKSDQDAVITKDEKAGTVDILLKVKEKGKQSIGLTGGVSGVSGSFIGFNYETNNFLGLGETLSLTANIGDLERNAQFAFTEPYFLGRPIQFGFSVFTSKYDYNQAKQVELTQGQQLNLPQTVLNTLQNYNQSTTGFTMSSSYQLRHSLKRVGLTYSFDKTSVTVFSDASRSYFETIAFRGITGPNALSGVYTSKLIPSFSYSTIDNPQRPHTGHSIIAGSTIAGLGGDIKEIRPYVEWKQFFPVNKGRNVLGYRVQAAFLTGYGNTVAPPYDRFYLGGDNDLRGFDTRSVSPVTFIPDRLDVPLVNPDGTPVPKDPTNPRRGNIFVPIPISRIVFPGGDTSLITNVEYRVPIVGPISVAAFVDFGLDFIARTSQLKLSDQQVSLLNTQPYGCPQLDSSFNCDVSLQKKLTFSRFLDPVNHTNFRPRTDTGLELQVILPVVNAPFRLYYAYNVMRLDTFTNSPAPITRDLFPTGAAGDFTYQQSLASFSPNYRLRDPHSTFRLTVSTTF